MNNITKYQTEADYTEDSANLEAPNVSVAKLEFLTHYKPIPTIVEVWDNGELTFRGEYPDGNIPTNCYTQDCDLLKIYGLVPTIIQERTQNVDLFGSMEARRVYLGKNVVSIASYGDVNFSWYNVEVSSTNNNYYSYNDSLYHGTSLLLLGEHSTIKEGTTRVEEYAGLAFSDTTLVFPSSIEYLGDDCFGGTPINTIIMNPTSVPDVYRSYSGSHGPFYRVMVPTDPTNSAKMYVPDESLLLYKTAWPNWANLIFPISQLPS